MQACRKLPELLAPGGRCDLEAALRLPSCEGAGKLAISLTIYRLSIYDKTVNRSFRDTETQKVFLGIRSRKFQAIEKIAIRKLFQLHAARTLLDLRAPGNALEALKGARAGRHSIRINDQYRLCFIWEEGDAYQVEITDYH